MKPFNLEEAKAGKPVVTRDGRPVSILTFDKKGDYCIVTLINYCRSDDVVVYRENGKASADFDSEYDLFMKAEKKEGWINIYAPCRTSCPTTDAIIYETEEKARSCSGNTSIATVKVEWEE